MSDNWSTSKRLNYAPWCPPAGLAPKFWSGWGREEDPLIEEEDPIIHGQAHPAPPKEIAWDVNSPEQSVILKIVSYPPLYPHKYVGYNKNKNF